jgi:peptidyl-prolyl cis-trans isomerase A (cyclophilin A)
MRIRWIGLQAANRFCILRLDAAETGERNSMIRLLAAVAAMGSALGSAAAIAQTAALASPPAFNERAPATYKAKFDTSKGVFIIEVKRDWAPSGADRFYNLVKNGFYNNVRFFRVISGFMVQFGINGDPNISAPWRDAKISDDPVVQSNRRGYITFAMAGPNTRTTQVFINFGANGKLDSQGFAPFGQVVSGMEVVDKLYAEYGEGAPRGRGPDQGRVQMEGNTYLMRDFPNLDFIKNATIETSSLDTKQSKPTNAEAQYMRGTQYHSGRGVSQDYSEALKWYRLAAAQRHPTAQMELGSMYELGQGVPRDNVRAHMWYNLSVASFNVIGASNGATSATGSRDSVAVKMSPVQIELAQELARKCEASKFNQCGEPRVANFPAPSQKTSKPEPSPESRKSSGTGFFVSANGHLITNYHVVDGCLMLKATGPSGSNLPVRVVQSSKADDLALLQANIKPGSVASFRDSNKNNQGETVIAYGYPLSGLLASSGNVSTGLLTALSGLRDNGRQMQISAPVQPGNSGGPLVDITGAVIGVVVSKLNAVAVARLMDDIPQNINFAIKSSAVINLLEASGVDYKTTKTTQELPIIEITKQLKTYTVRIECN